MNNSEIFYFSEPASPDKIEQSDFSERKAEIAGIETEMREYLNEIKKDFPDVLGMLLHGSRLNENKKPREDSDVDLALILEESDLTGSKLESRWKKIEPLVNFVREHKTASGFEVEPNDFYTNSEFIQELKSREVPETLRGKLIWGADPASFKYIGSPLNWPSGEGDNKIISEKEINENLKKEFFSEEMKNFKDKVKKEQDVSELAQVRASLEPKLPRPVDTNNDLRQYFHDYLELKEGETEKIELIKAKDLPKNYQEQKEALNDDRLDNITIAIIPDDLWVKGSQPSESEAEKQLISIKQSYFEAQKNPDEIAWMIHELAHCQNFLDSDTPEDYEKNMQKLAFEDLKTKYTYPNNPVEQYTFTKQFEFLKEQGKSREDIVGMISNYYHEEDLPFFDRLLNNVYGK